MAIDYIIEQVGEHYANGTNEIRPSGLKEFVSVPFFIPWYRSAESRKVFPIILDELSQVNPVKSRMVPANPFFGHTDSAYLIAKSSDGVPIGRIMAFVDHKYNEENNENAGWVGMFESVEGREVGPALLMRAFHWLSRQKCSKVIGPAKFNANGEAGLLIGGFQHSPYFMEPYNPPYYKDYFEKELQFSKRDDWFSHIMDETSSKVLNYIEKIEEMKDRLLERQDFSIRNASMKNIGNEIKIIKGIYNSEWADEHHPEFVKMTDAEFDSLASGIKTIALEELIFIAEQGGKPIGVSVTVPNINEVIAEYDAKHPNYIPSRHFLSPSDFKRDLGIFSEIRRKVARKQFNSARILIVGIDKEHRKTGLDALLYYYTFKNGIALGMKEGSGSQTAERNLDMVRPLDNMGRRAFHWRVYERSL